LPAGLPRRRPAAAAHGVSRRRLQLCQAGREPVARRDVGLGRTRAPEPDRSRAGHSQPEPAMKSVRILSLVATLVTAFSAQSLVGRSEQPPASTAIAGGGPFDSLHFRPIGPASMSGRISDLAVYEPNPAIYYVGTAHGGVWKTTNGGTTFEAQFQDHGLISIGDVTVSQ